MYFKNESRDFEQMFSIVDKEVFTAWGRLNQQYPGRQANTNNSHLVGPVIPKTIFEGVPVLEMCPKTEAEKVCKIHVKNMTHINTFFTTHYLQILQKKRPLPSIILASRF
jgi:hypothetical protein